MKRTISVTFKHTHTHTHTQQIKISVLDLLSTMHTYMLTTVIFLLWPVLLRRQTLSLVHAKLRATAIPVDVVRDDLCADYNVGFLSAAIVCGTLLW